MAGDELRLDKPDGRGLRFRVRDTIYPSRELRPLLQGRRDGGDYRFGWQAGEAGIGDRLRRRRARAGTVASVHVLTTLRDRS